MMDERAAREIGEIIGVPLLKTTIAGSIVVGSLAAMNLNGAVVSNFAEKHELARFPMGMRVGIMEEKGSSTTDNQIFLPVSAYQRYVAGSPKYALINIQTSSVERMRDLKMAGKGASCKAA